MPLLIPPLTPPVFQKSVMSTVGVIIVLMWKTRLLISHFPDVAPNRTQPKAECLATKSPRCRVSPVCSVGLSIPIRISTGPSFLQNFSFLIPNALQISSKFTEDVLLLIDGIPMALITWVALFSYDRILTS